MKKKQAIAVILAAALLTGCSDSDDSSDSVSSKAKRNSETTSTEAFTEEVPEFDADKYFEENSEKIIAVESAKTYSNVISAGEAADMMKDRGFTQNPLEFNFDSDGKYLGSSEATEKSEVKSPYYKTTYFTENEILWTVYVAGNSVIACPVSYNFGSENKAELILSESEQLVSYNDNENKFYITIPKKSFARIAVVDRIDAGTLESYTKEALEKLWKSKD